MNKQLMRLKSDTKPHELKINVHIFQSIRKSIFTYSKIKKVLMLVCISACVCIAKWFAKV